MALKGKVAVVTGGGQGIGRATALRLAQEGAAVAVWGRTARTIDETVAMITAAGGKAMACVADATVKAEIQAAAEQTRTAFGTVSVLINNAGVADFRPFLEISEQDVDGMLRANIVGPMLCAQAVLPGMLAAGWGRIVNITSIAAQDGFGTHAHYSASKGGLISLTKSLAIEFAGTGVTVNHIPVFFVDTPRLHNTPYGDPNAVAAMFPAKRMGKAEEVAAACAFLASDDAAYISGQPLSLNGGRYLP